MEKEGKKIFSDLRAVKHKKIKPKYSGKKYRIPLSPKNSLTISALFILVILLFVFLSNTTLYKAFKLAYTIKNQTLLIGFQNSAELRPTGGFWGSFGLLKTSKNLFDSTLYFETNPYKQDNDLMSKSSIDLPKPFKETWPDRSQSFVNANYSVDFPETAKSLQWFLNEGWGEKTDGVVAISSLALIDLLKKTGPINYRSEMISSENFTKFMSDKIEKDYWAKPENIAINEPKTILQEIAPQIIQKTKDIPIPELYAFIRKQLENGRIIMFFNEQKQQKIVKSLDASGELKQYKLDYLNINNTNLNGGKSSLNVKQIASYSVSEADPRPVAKLIITRKASAAWPFILNRNYMRIFTPLGSELRRAVLSGDDITDQIEIGKEKANNFFGLWFSVASGEEQTLELVYELPFENSDLANYNLIWQKQPGTLADDISIIKQSDTLYQGPMTKNYISVP